MTASAMPAPWRIEARANPFVPWIVLRAAEHRLDEAVRAAEALKAMHHYYAVRVRAN